MPLNTATNMPPQQPSFLKFVTITRYDSAMFEIIEISPSQNQYFRIKPYKDREYVYIPLKKLKCISQLMKNAIYLVTHVKTWIYEKEGDKYGCIKYFLKLHKKPDMKSNTRVDRKSDDKPKCLFIKG